MATGWDTNQIQSLVIFNEISPVYCLSDDIECRFYVDPSLDCCLDKIGLYRIGWTHKQDFLVIKDVHNCMTDEFDERKLVFPTNQLPEDVVRENTEYQFCYFHPFGDKKSYQLCGRSESFRFSKSDLNPIENHRKASPSAPEITINYPLLDMDINQTTPKKLFNSTDSDFDELFRTEDVYLNSTPKSSDLKSIDFEIQIKNIEINELKERFAQQNRIKDLEIERLETTVRLGEEKVSSLEYELQTKVENEDRLEHIHNELMDTIRVSEAKNCSLEEQLHKRENQIKLLSAQCQSNEKLIDELTEKLAISRSEIDLYQSTVDTIGSIQSNPDLRQESRLLKDKLQEVMDISEKLKENNDRLIREKRVLDKNKLKIQTELEFMRQKFAELKLRSDKTEEDKLNISLKLRSKEVLIKQYADILKVSEQNHSEQLSEEPEDDYESNITIHANEMIEEVKDYCIAQTTDALNKYSDIKSMADSIVYAMDEKFGNSWVCYIGQDFAHNSLLHVFGTYFAFGINDLKIIVYKCNDMPDFDQVIRWAKESPNVDILFKNEFSDNGFEDIVVSTVMESINEEFCDYCELSAHMTRILNSKYGQKYGYNWFAVCGESDRFDSNLLIFTKKYKCIELEINCLKVIVIQFDEKTIENPNTLYGFKSFANKIF